jgi:hypothetical protein
MNTQMGFILSFVMAVWPDASKGQTEARPNQVRGAIKVHREAAGTAGSDGWFEATSTEGHFRVQVPAKFTDSTEYKLEPPGAVKGFVLSSKNSDAIFEVTETPSEVELPRVRKFQEMMRDHQVKVISEATSAQPGALLYDVRKSEVSGFPAFDYRLHNKGQVTIGRTIFLPERTYFVTAKYPSEHHSKASPQTKKFFDSFQLDPPQQANYPSAEEERRIMFEYLVKLEESGKLKSATKKVAPAQK